EVCGQGQIAPEADGETAHAAHDWQVNRCDQFDDPVRGVGNATEEVAGATAWLTAVVCGYPVRTGAEIAAVAADMHGAKGGVGGGSRQRADECVDHPVAQRV